MNAGFHGDEIVEFKAAPVRRSGNFIRSAFPKFLVA